MTNGRFKVSFFFASRCCVCEMALAAICPPFQTCNDPPSNTNLTSLPRVGWLSKNPASTNQQWATKRQSISLFYHVGIRNLLNVFKHISAQDGVDPFINAEEIFSEASQRIQPHAPRARLGCWCPKVRSLLPVIVFVEFCSKDGFFQQFCSDACLTKNAP